MQKKLSLALGPVLAQDHNGNVHGDWCDGNSGAGACRSPTKAHNFKHWPISFTAPTDDPLRDAYTNPSLCLSSISSTSSMDSTSQSLPLVDITESALGDDIALRVNCRIRPVKRVH